MKPLLLALLLCAAEASAQVCCTAGGAIEPARLMMHEKALVALQLHGSNGWGSLDRSGGFVFAPEGVRDTELQQTLIGTVRVLRRAQFALALPIVEIWRDAGSVHELGGGIGDVSLSGRWDFVYPAESETVPGIGVIAGAAFPTGRAPESAGLPLGSDATGTGVNQLRAGVNLEQVFGDFVLSGTIAGAYALPHRVGGVNELLGPELNLVLAGGYAINPVTQLALTFASLRGTDAVIDGAVAHGTARGLSSVALTAGRQLGRAWRLNAGLSCDLPWLGQNRPVGFGGSFMLIHAWD